MNTPPGPQESEPEGHYFSVVCPEETSLIDMDMARAEAEGAFAGSFLSEYYIDACNAWGLPRHPAHPIEEKVFDTPALIFTGARDPVTQPEYGDQIAGHFIGARHIVFEHGAHGVDGFENDECYGRIIDDFVTAASLEDLDVSCIAGMTPPSFRLE